jgi:quercetin dioxygenase-like cupin family protein
MAHLPSVQRVTSVSIIAALCTLVGIAFTKEMLDEPKVWPYAEMQWTKDQVLPSVQTVLLWGNPKSGENGMLRRFPAGYAPPPHTHPSAERVVVVSGTILVRHSGASAKSLGPGSYSEIPANVVHAVKCGEGSDCEFLLASPGPFAIVPVAEDK